MTFLCACVRVLPDDNVGRTPQGGQAPFGRGFVLPPYSSRMLSSASTQLPTPPEAVVPEAGTPGGGGGARTGDQEPGRFAMLPSASVVWLGLQMFAHHCRATPQLPAPLVFPHPPVTLPRCVFVLVCVWASGGIRAPTTLATPGPDDTVRTQPRPRDTPHDNAVLPAGEVTASSVSPGHPSPSTGYSQAAIDTIVNLASNERWDAVRAAEEAGFDLRASDRHGCVACWELSV